MISVITESCGSDTSVYLTLVRGQRKTARRVGSLAVRELGCVGLGFGSLWGHHDWNRREYISMLQSCVAGDSRILQGDSFAVWQVVCDKLKAHCDPSKCWELLRHQHKVTFLQTCKLSTMLSLDHPCFNSVWISLKWTSSLVNKDRQMWCHLLYYFII